MCGLVVLALLACLLECMNAGLLCLLAGLHWFNWLCWLLAVGYVACVGALCCLVYRIRTHGVASVECVGVFSCLHAGLRACLIVFGSGIVLCWSGHSHVIACLLACPCVAAGLGCV